tara:strand:+ start:2516 stop:3241 length:726 start_codon:yes stop_codon:yes gene_type:complete
MFSIFKKKNKVMIFIDGSNLYHVLIKNCGRSDLKFLDFANKLTGPKRSLEKIYYYNVRQELQGKIKIPEEQQKFLTSLRKIPKLEVKLGIWKEQNGSIVEKGVDVMLATDLVLHAVKNNFDTAIIVSGDGDFFPAMETAKKEGKRIEVAAFESNISREASESSNNVIKLRKSFFNHLWMPKRNYKNLNFKNRKESNNSKKESNNSKKESNNSRKKSNNSRKESNYNSNVNRSQSKRRKITS